VNTTLEKQMRVADSTLAANGEAQPPAADGRAATSPANGSKGGRPSIDWGEVAERFQAHFGTSVRWYKGEFYEYAHERGAYRRMSAAEEGARVGAFLRVPGAPAKYGVNAERNTLGALRATFNPLLSPPCFTDTGRSAAGWVAMRNGLLNVEAAARGEAGALTPHTPTFFSTAFLPYDWTPCTPCPRFMRFIEEVLPTPDAREMARMLAGLLLVPDTVYNVFFVLLGEGGCGKSTFLRIVGAMLGPDNVCSVPLSMIAEKHTSHRLTRCLANLVDDSPTVDSTRGQSLAGVEGVLKQVTGGGLLHVEPKGVDPWEAPAIARCVFCQNPPLPSFVDRSEAIWDRLRVIPFPMRFRGTEEQNPRLAEEIIESELPGIFAWAVGGLGVLRKLREFPQCAEGASVIAEHRGTCDRERAFLADRYTYSSGAFTPSAEIYAAYRAWCEAEGYRGQKSSSSFAFDVLRVFPQVKNDRVCWMGKQQRGFLNLARLVEKVDEV
jgi:P4 family phage/plasmid primase-like protien